MENPKNFRRRSNREEEKESPEGKRLLESLPNHILEEKILFQLPLKAVLTCRCVSKYLYAIISNPSFLQLYHARTRASLLLKISTNNIFHLNLHFFDLQNDYLTANRTLTTAYLNPLCVRVSSCNGLACITSMERGTEIFVCNPLLGDHVALPKPPCKRWQACVAIGFSPRTQEYMVLRIVQITSSRRVLLYHEAEVYVIGGCGSWSNVGRAPSGIFSFVRPYYFDKSACTYVNGAVHWASTVKSGGGYCRIWAFSFDELKFHEVHKGERFGRKAMRIGELNGWLCVCDAHESPSLAIDVWVMKEYGLEESWTKLFTINNSIMGEYDYLVPFGVLSDGRILMMSKSSKESVMSYDPQTGVFNCLCLLDSNHSCGEHFHFIGGAPNLLSLGNILAKKEREQTTREKESKTAGN